jgi:hypothetical protein
MLNRLPTIAALYAIHGVTWCAIKVLDGCLEAARRATPDVYWCEGGGGQHCAETSCVHCNGTGTIGDDYCPRCNHGIVWLTPAELAKELRNG